MASNFSAMLLLKNLALIALWFLAPVCALSGAAPAEGSHSQAQTDQPSQAPSESDNKILPDQTAPIVSGDSTELEPIRKQKAAYPQEAPEKQLQGEVLVKLTVSATGDVDSVEVIRGDPILAKAAVEAANNWKFKPFIKNGKPTAISGNLPFYFVIPENGHDSAKAPKQVSLPPGVGAGLLIHRVSPVYPDEARAHIQGTVLLQAQISKGGTIANLRLISGPPELAQAAIKAVQKWRYCPYLEMGQPVEVETQIQVNFQLK